MPTTLLIQKLQKLGSTVKTSKSSWKITNKNTKPCGDRTGKWEFGLWNKKINLVMEKAK